MIIIHLWLCYTVSFVLAPSLHTHVVTADDWPSPGWLFLAVSSCWVFSSHCRQVLAHNWVIWLLRFSLCCYMSLPYKIKCLYMTVVVIWHYTKELNQIYLTLYIQLQIRDFIKIDKREFTMIIWNSRRDPLLHLLNRNNWTVQRSRPSFKKNGSAWAKKKNHGSMEVAVLAIWHSQPTFCSCQPLND